MFFHTAAVIIAMSGMVISDDSLAVITYQGSNCRSEQTGRVELQSFCTTAGNSQSILLSSLTQDGCYAELYDNDACTGESVHKEFGGQGDCIETDGFSSIEVYCAVYNN